jgi:putative DNA primase/helicase
MMALEDLRHPKAGRPTMGHLYRDQAGAPVLVACRFEQKDGTKFFLPFDVVRDDWKAPEERPLYRLEDLLAANDNRAVVLVEGEKCADALAARGFLAMTTFGGAMAAKKSDLSPLAGRAVVIWPDLDAPGRAYAEQLAEILHGHGARPRIVPVCQGVLAGVRPYSRQTDSQTDRQSDSQSASGGHDARIPDSQSDSGGDLWASSGNSLSDYPKGWDVADAIAEGWSDDEIRQLLRLAEAFPPEPPLPEPPRQGTPRQGIPEPGQVADFPELEVWRTPDGSPHVSITVAGRQEHHPLDARAFSSWLAREHYLREGSAPSANAVDAVRRQLEGQARFDAPVRKAFTRLGAAEGALELDLGTPDRRAVEIRPEGWRIVSRPSLRFLRGGALEALPIPTQGQGDSNLLRDFLNVETEDDFRLLIAWLIGCLHPTGPYPILILTGEQGSAKSTAARILRSLIDPARPATRSCPKDERDLVIAAQASHIVAFDNLSRVNGDLADALCRLSTGGGFGTRKLHTNSEEMLFDVTRPVLLNGIPDLAGRADLADRSIIIELPVIGERARRSEAELWEAFEAARPRILAGLLDAASAALAGHRAVRLERAPRMADFARWVCAAEGALGWPSGAFLAAYAGNRAQVGEAALEGSVLALCILELVKGGRSWCGTASELLQEVRERAHPFTDDRQAIPRQANRLSSELRRITPLLRGRGVEVVRERTGRDRTRRIAIKGA